MGLYCKITIALFYFVLILLFKVIAIIKKKKRNNNKFKLLSLTRYKRYIKLVFTKKVIVCLMLFSVISNTIVLIQNYKYNNLFLGLDNQNIVLDAIIIKKNENNYKIKVLNGKYKNTFLYLNTNKELNIGLKVNINGIFQEPSQQRNYRGFDYKKYLKTKKIYGTIKSNTIIILEESKRDNFLRFKNRIYNKVKCRIEKLVLNETESSILKGVLIGDKSEFSEEIINNFSKSNISHILAISGMHINCLIIMVSFILNKVIGKHYSKVLICFIIVFYILVINISPSVIRAGICGIILILSNFFYKKSDVFENLGISILIILVYNPYLILDIGLILSYISTIGIFTFMPIIRTIIKSFIERKKLNTLRKNKQIQKKIIKFLNTKIAEILIDSIVLCISVNIVLAPFILIYYNKINIFSISVGFLASFTALPIIISGIIVLILSFLKIEILLIPAKFFLSFFIEALLKISEFGKILPFGQINFISIPIYCFIFYYLFFFLYFIIVKLKMEKNKDLFQMRILNLYHLFKYEIKRKRKKILVFLLIVIIIFNLFQLIPNNLKIYFIDVGQRGFNINCYS